MCILIFSASFYEKFRILRTERDTIKMFIGLHVKFLLFSSDFNETWIFSTEFRKILKFKFHENPSSGAQLFHADGQTW
jgi:hypothetical protein